MASAVEKELVRRRGQRGVSVRERGGGMGGARAGDYRSRRQRDRLHTG